MLLICSGCDTLDAFGASRPDGVEVAETNMFDQVGRGVVKGMVVRLA